MDWKKLGTRLLEKLKVSAPTSLDAQKWAKSQENAGLERAADVAARVLPLVEGEGALEFKNLVAQAETGMVEDLLVALGERRVDDARDLARMIDGQRRAVGLLEQAVRRGAAASMELAERRKVF